MNPPFSSKYLIFWSNSFASSFNCAFSYSKSPALLRITSISLYPPRKFSISYLSASFSLCSYWVLSIRSSALPCFNFNSSISLLIVLFSSSKKLLSRINLSLNSLISLSINTLLYKSKLYLLSLNCFSLKNRIENDWTFPQLLISTPEHPIRVRFVWNGIF